MDLSASMSWLRTKTHALIIVYDASERDCLDDVKYWFNNVQRYFQQDYEDGMHVLLVGNKLDLVDTNNEDNCANTESEIKEFSLRYEFLPPIRCSAKTGENVKNVFKLIVDELTKPKVTYKPVVPVRRRNYYANKLCVCM